MLMTFKTHLLLFILPLLFQLSTPQQGLSQSVNCPLMQVRLTTDGLVACQTATYAVQYCNEGNLTAPAVRLTLTLPVGMTFQGSTPAPQSVFGNIVNYNLNTVAPGVCGSIALRVQVPCNAAIGQAFCVRASITPDNCLPTANGWSGATLNVGSRCFGGGDSLLFTVRNHGTAPSTIMDYIILEDHIIFRTGTIGGLGPDDTTNVTLYNVTGKTYTFQMAQVPNHPLRRDLSLSAEGCGGLPTAGVLMQYPQYTGDPFTEVFCEAVTAAVAGNEKRGFPIGYQTPHYIEPNTVLQYRINFVNPGATTLNKVVITDTIPAALDLNTLRTGPSSHPYTADLQGRILTLAFNDLNLPPGGRGFVSLFLQPLEGLNLPTAVLNRAYLSYENAVPIVSNAVMHTIGIKFLKTSAADWTRHGLSLRMDPNPAADRVLIKVEGPTPPEIRHWRLFDSKGTLVKSGVSTANALTLDVAELSTGVYFLQLQTDKGVTAGGKLFVQ